MAEYKLNRTGGVIRESDDAVIPADAKNIDWKEYQRWLNVGGIPDPADPVPPPPIDRMTELVDSIKTASDFADLKTMVAAIK